MFSKRSKCFPSGEDEGAPRKEKLVTFSTATPKSGSSKQGIGPALPGELKGESFCTIETPHMCISNRFWYQFKYIVISKNSSEIFLHKSVL
jgi:hypothetical protein